MRIVHQVAALGRALFHSGRVDADLAEEMRFHVERETLANIGRGMSPEAAARAARLAFGSVDAAQEASRDDRPGAAVRQTLADIRFGARLLRKSPVFAITGVAIVALGIGAATAIFSVVHGVMLRPLPYPEPDRLVAIWLQRGTGRLYPNAADVAAMRELRTVLVDVALVRNANLNLVGDGEPARLQGARVSPNLFAVLGVGPAFGRAFAADEDRPGRSHVVLLSDGLWRTRFGADSAIVGRSIHLNGSMHTVIGVMPRGFYSPAYTRAMTMPSASVDAWIPNVLDPGELTRERINNYLVVGRLRNGATLDQARTELAGLATRLGTSYSWNRNATFSVDPMLDDAVRDIRPALSLLLGAVSFLLLIACVNLSNLFGARASARRSEFAVRLALGASRMRLIAQAIAEAAPVLVLGGALGVAIAQAAVRAFIASAPPGLPRIESLQLTPPVLLASLVVLAVTGIAASIAPAVQAWASDFTSVTKDGGRASTAGRGRAVARRVGVALQVAFALPLLVGAGLLIKSALNVSRVEMGFQPENVSTWSFEVSRAKHVADDAAADYLGRLVEAVRAVPGVSNAAVVNRIPLSGAQSNPIYFENATADADAAIDVDTRPVTPEYFATLGIRVRAGRAFTDRDDASAPVVGIVDEHVARTMWPGQSAIGKRFRGPDGRWATIVGVVDHVRTASLETDPRPQVYWSYRQWVQNRAVLAVRSTLSFSALSRPVVRAIRSVDPDQSVFDARTMSEIVDRSLAQRRVTTFLMAGFSGLALLLSAVGIYGVVAYGVTQRLREFGIRVALGATRSDVTRLVVWHGTSMAIAGSVFGLALALTGATVMSNLVYGVAPTDFASLLVATTLLLLVALVASYVPARRAAAVDPGTTLRSE